MTKAELEQYIKDRIYPNNAQEITGEALQDVLLQMAESASEEFDKKQNSLISGENIKTYGGLPILGSGDLLAERKMVIYYTSTDGKIIRPSYTQGNKVISNTYDNGFGILIFQDFDLPNGIFDTATKLESVVLPNGINRIPPDAFYDCTSLKEIVIPDSVVSISSRAFYFCARLRSTTIGKGVTDIANDAFYYCGGELIINSKSLVEADYASSDKTPGGLWLSGTRFNRIVIGNGITRIGSRWFLGYDSLKEIVIPDSVTSIGGATFQLCSNLQSVTIPTSVSEIGAYCFRSCSNLQSVIVTHSTPPILGQSAFNSTNCIIVVDVNSLSTYRSSTNWSDYTRKMFGTEYIQYSDNSLFPALALLEKRLDDVL